MGNRLQTGLHCSQKKANKQSLIKKKLDYDFGEKEKNKSTDGRNDVSDFDSPSVSRSEIIDVFDAEKTVKIVPLVLMKPKQKISSKTILAVKQILAREESDESILSTVIEDKFSIDDDSHSLRSVSDKVMTFSLVNSTQYSSTMNTYINQSQRLSEINNMDLTSQITSNQIGEHTSPAPAISAASSSLTNTVRGAPLPVNTRRPKLGTRGRFVQRRVQMISPQLLPGIVPSDRRVKDVMEELDLPHDLGHAFSFPNRTVSSRIICIKEENDEDVLVTVPAFKSFISSRDLDLGKNKSLRVGTRAMGTGRKDGKISEVPSGPADEVDGDDGDDDGQGSDDGRAVNTLPGDDDIVSPSRDDGLTSFQRGSLMTVTKAIADGLTSGRPDSV